MLEIEYQIGSILDFKVDYMYWMTPYGYGDKEWPSAGERWQVKKIGPDTILLEHIISKEERKKIDFRIDIKELSEYVAVSKLYDH